MATQKVELATLKEWARGHDVAHIQRQAVVDREFKVINDKLDEIHTLLHSNHNNRRYLNRGTAVGGLGGMIGGGGIGTAVYIILDKLGVFS